MNTLVIQPTVVAQWQVLVHDAEQVCHANLGEELQSYLVFLLMRHTKASELSSSVLALEYLGSMEAHGQVRHERLREVGDKCLLYAGLFPGQAERRRVRISYYVDIGVNAYALLASSLAGMKAKIFNELSYQFVLLMDVLQAVRELGTDVPALQPLQAMELWSDTDSQHAFVTLSRYTQAMPIKATVTHSKSSLYKKLARRRGKSPYN